MFDLMVMVVFFTACNRDRSNQVDLVFMTLLLDLI